jgi:DNA-binding NarL/FixJ family response regulator
VLVAREHAFEGHINYIFAKLGANGHTEATCIAIKQGK